jgi:hypothetical protein
LPLIYKNLQSKLLKTRQRRPFKTDRISQAADLYHIERLVAVAFLIRHFLDAPDMLLALTIVQIILGLLLWGWTEIPLFFREAIHKMLQRRRDDEKK